MKEDFKNIIKQTADNHLDDINPDMIWSGIESKLRQNKKRRFVGYWILGGLSLVTAFLIYAFVWFSEYSMDASNAVNYASANEVSGEVSVFKELNVKEEIVVNKEDVIDQEINKYELIGEAKLKNEIIDNDRSELLEYAMEDEVDKRNLKTITSQKVALDEGHNFNTNNIVASQGLSNSMSSVIGINGSNRVIENSLAATQEEEHYRESNDLNPIQSRELLFIRKIELILVDGLHANERVVNIDNCDEFVFNAPYVIKEKNINFLSGVEVYSGLSFGEKSVSDLDHNYAQLRNDSEQLLEQWSVGVRFDLIKVLDFQLQSGVRYSMITDRMQVVNEYKDLTEFTYVKSRLVDDAIIVIDSMVVVDSIPQIFAYTTEQYNSQRIISIPLEVSFGKSFSKFDLGFGFGVDINYYLSDTHVILDENAKPSVNKVGGKWANPSFSGALLVGYHLNDNWSITSRVNFRGLSLSDHERIGTLKSNYKLYGMEFGLKKRFGR